MSDGTVSTSGVAVLTGNSVLGDTVEAAVAEDLGVGEFCTVEVDALMLDCASGLAIALWNRNVPKKNRATVK